MDMNIKDYRKHSPGVKRKSKVKQTMLAAITPEVPAVSPKTPDTTPDTCNATPEARPAAMIPEVMRLRQLEKDSRKTKSLEELKEEPEDSDALKTSSNERLEVKVRDNHVFDSGVLEEGHTLSGCVKVLGDAIAIN